VIHSDHGVQFTASATTPHLKAALHNKAHRDVFHAAMILAAVLKVNSETTIRRRTGTRSG
jgi:hypothetical protein